MTLTDWWDLSTCFIIITTIACLPFLALSCLSITKLTLYDQLQFVNPRCEDGTNDPRSVAYKTCTVQKKLVSKAWKIFLVLMLVSRPHVFVWTLLRRQWMWVYLTANRFAVRWFCFHVIFGLSLGFIESVDFNKLLKPKSGWFFYTVVTLTWWCLGNGRKLPCSSWSRRSENTMWQNLIPSKFSTKLRYVFPSVGLASTTLS